MGRTSRMRKRKQRRIPLNNLSSNVHFIQLARWMSEHNWLPKCELGPVDFHDTGRGLLTRKKIECGEDLVSIPIQLLIRVSTVDKSNVACIFHNSLETEFCAQQVLATYLVWEKFLSNQSQWNIYISSLPVEFTTPLFCSSDELNALPPSIMEQVTIQKNKVFSTFQEVLTLLEDLKICNYCKTDCTDLFRNFELKYTDYAWAWSVVNTRSVYLESSERNNNSIRIKDKDCLALAPYLDMFNHSNEADVDVGLSTDGMFYSIRTLVPFKKHSQVFIHYGHHSNQYLYLEYGFILPNNAHDLVVFTFNDVSNAVKEVYPSDYNYSRSKYNFITSHNISNELMCTSEGLSFNARALIYILMVPEFERKQFHNKIYSSDFDKKEIGAIVKVGQLLIEMKKAEFIQALETMKKSEFNQCSASFIVAKSLMTEFLNMLQKAMISLSHFNVDF